MILRISEARDLGDISRYAFYEHLKPYMAAPPDVLRVDQKTHPRTRRVQRLRRDPDDQLQDDGIYLPADDRRHFVCWSDAKKEDFTADYWTDLWSWYHHGGLQHVAAYLRTLDLRASIPRRRRRRLARSGTSSTPSRAPEDAELADVLDEMETRNRYAGKVGARSQADFMSGLATARTDA